MKSFTNQLVDNLYDFIASKKQFESPFYSISGVSYHDDLKLRFKLLKVYLIDFFKNNYVDENEKDVFFGSYKNLTEGMIYSIELYLKGNPGLAYSAFTDKLNKDILLNEYLPHFSAEWQSFGYYEEDEKSPIDHKKGLYRVRVSDSHLNKIEEMFHVPFEKRHLVANQRYSIAGLPSLYLGSSIFCCWEEMDRPDLNKLYVSKFKTSNKGVKVLNFAYKISHSILENNVFNHIDTRVARLVFYPILMACSYVKKYKNASFNEEYIIPNMLLLWIKEISDPIDGIAYYSNKTFQNDGHQLGINFVFPPRDSYSEGYCLSLVEKFQLSKPISWQLLDTLPIKGEGSSNYSPGAPAINNVEDDFFDYYQYTGFGKQEFKLRGVKVFTILTSPKS